MKYQITDITKFIDSARVIVYNNYITDQNEKTQNEYIFEYDKLTDQEKKEIDSCLSHSESLAIFNEITKNKNSFTDKKFQKFLDHLCHRMTSNIINILVNKGLLETAFDETKNDFIFWAK